MFLKRRTTKSLKKRSKTEFPILKGDMYLILDLWKAMTIIRQSKDGAYSLTQSKNIPNMKISPTTFTQ
jgi:hypothetical protein